MHAADGARQQRDEHEPPHSVVKDREGKDGLAEVDEDARLGDHGGGLENRARGLRGILAHVWPCKPRHDHAAEEQRHNSRKLKSLGNVVGRPWKGKAEGDDEDEVVLAGGRADIELAKRVGEREAEGGTDRERGHEVEHEDEGSESDAQQRRLRRSALEREERAREHNGDGVVEDRLAKDDGEYVIVDADGLEDAQHRHRVRR
mmetsp:Transcript_39709/g.104862  ORF Transcript_39709/g.104862 Transcript_39709/m.104862 type:complete len:203 (+) Transcript_39709:635-1243(+)